MKTGLRENRTELVLYMVQGANARLIRVDLGMVLPGFDLLTPPQFERAVDPTLPVDTNAPIWRVKLTEATFEFPEQRAALRKRIRVIYPKGQTAPSPEWVDRAVANLMHTVH